jgi:Ni,Fe-hydrogenase III large subunit
VLRKVFLIGIVALVAALPAQANEGKELRISGLVVRASGELVSVENRVGDAILTCRVPKRLAEKAAALKPGDVVRMVCVRFKGRRAELRMLARLGDKPEKAGEGAGEKKPDPTTQEKRGEKQEAAGQVAELGFGVIVVQADAGRLACRVPAERQAKLEGLKVGDKVKIYCLDGVLAGIERATSVEERRLYGRITALSRESVTVQGEAGSLTCTAPASMAGSIAEHFAVGDSVKMICRGSEISYLAKP